MTCRVQLSSYHAPGTTSGVAAFVAAYHASFCAVVVAKWNFDDAAVTSVPSVRSQSVGHELPDGDAVPTSVPTCAASIFGTRMPPFRYVVSAVPSTNTPDGPTSTWSHSPVGTLWCHQKAPRKSGMRSTASSVNVLVPSLLT